MPRKVKLHNKALSIPQRLNILYGKPDSFYLYLAIHKMSLKIKELFHPSYNRSSVLRHMDTLKQLLRCREKLRDKYIADIDTTHEEQYQNKVNSSLDDFEQWVDKFSWTDLLEKSTYTYEIGTSSQNPIDKEPPMENIEPTSNKNNNSEVECPPLPNYDFTFECDEFFHE